MKFRYRAVQRGPYIITGREEIYACLLNTSTVRISSLDDLPEGTRDVLIINGRHNRTLTPTQFRNSQAYSRK